MNNKTKRVRNAVRIYTCSGKSLVRLAYTVAILISACACTTQPKTDFEQPDMWNVYCEKYGVDPNVRPTNRKACTLTAIWGAWNGNRILTT